MPFEQPKKESEETPSPDLYFVPNLVVPESQYDRYVDIFADTRLPVFFENIDVFRTMFKKYVRIAILDKTLQTALEESGNEVGLKYWRKEQQALSLTGMVFRPEEGKFIDPATKQEISTKEVLKRKKKAK